MTATLLLSIYFMESANGEVLKLWQFSLSEAARYLKLYFVTSG